MDALPDDGYHEGRGRKSLRCARGRIKHDLKTEPMPVIMDSDAQKEAAGMEELLLGDLVQMRKTHPCGSDKWTVIRVGADIKIRCSGCGRIVMMDRADFTKRMKKVLAHATEPIRGTNETD
jgi:hypothetical protein